MHYPFAAYVKERCEAVSKDEANIIFVSSDGRVKDS